MGKREKLLTTSNISIGLDLPIMGRLSGYTLFIRFDGLEFGCCGNLLRARHATISRFVAIITGVLVLCCGCVCVCVLRPRSRPRPPLYGYYNYYGFFDYLKLSLQIGLFCPSVFFYFNIDITTRSPGLSLPPPPLLLSLPLPFLLCG